eukprot:jgi/Mesen1/10900/ME000095S10235
MYLLQCPAYRPCMQASAVCRLKKSLSTSFLQAQKDFSRSVQLSPGERVLPSRRRMSLGETTQRGDIKDQFRSTRALSSGPSRNASSSGRRAFDALLVDVGGTLLETAAPVPETYAAIGAKYGVKASPESIKQGFKQAFAQPWPERLRYEGDGRKFWRHAVALATGCSDAAFFEELYGHYSRGDAWRVADGAAEALQTLRTAG